MAKTQDSSLPQNSLSTPASVDEDEFFTHNGSETLATDSDLEAIVPNNKKPDLVELERYWANKPYVYIVIFRDESQQELSYYAVEPALTDEEEELLSFLTDKLQLSINYESVGMVTTQEKRAEVIQDELFRLLHRYNLVPITDIVTDESPLSRLKQWVLSQGESLIQQDSQSQVDAIPEAGKDGQLQLTDTQIDKLSYYVTRNFVRYGKIDPLKQDVHVEDISCNGPETRVWVYHSGYKQVLTNVKFSSEELDQFVVSAAQSAGKGISQRNPDVNASLTDGSRAQLTLGTEVSDKGTNFTIREFTDVPFTPIDLIAWETYSIDQMTYLWLAIQNGLNMVVSGGTASGKTTTLNALSLFIPSDHKIVSIEDTREIEIPQKNWLSSVTRESFQEGDGNEITEYDLVENALRQRPKYIVMGEVRGDEAQALFQAMNTGHTVFTTFHGNDTGEVLKRFTNDPLNVSDPMIDALDIVINQKQTQIDGREVRRVSEMFEIKGWGAQQGEANGTNVYGWDSRTDEHRRETGSFQNISAPDSEMMNHVMSLNGWDKTQMYKEWKQRKFILAYLLKEGVNSYANVASVIQAYYHGPDVVLKLIKEDKLTEVLDSLRKMDTIAVNISQEKEESVPRPSVPAHIQNNMTELLNTGSAQEILATGVDIDISKIQENETTQSTTPTESLTTQQTTNTSVTDKPAQPQLESDTTNTHPANDGSPPQEQTDPSQSSTDEDTLPQNPEIDGQQASSDTGAHESSKPVPKTKSSPSRQPSENGTQTPPPGNEDPHSQDEQPADPDPDPDADSSTVLSEGGSLLDDIIDEHSRQEEIERQEVDEPTDLTDILDKHDTTNGQNSQSTPNDEETDQEGETVNDAEEADEKADLDD